MKFLIIGDLHGNKPKTYYNGFDAIVAPGDFCSDATRKYMFQALKDRLENPNSKLKWYDLTGKTQARKMIKKSLSDGRKILKQLNSFDVPVYIVPGNWDWVRDRNDKWNFLRQNHYKGLIKGFNNIVDVHHKIIDIGNYQIIGHGISFGPEYPQYKEELKKIKPKLLQKIKKKYERDSEKISLLFKKRTKPIIFLSHNVPFNTLLDIITEKESPRYGRHCGSLITREMIDKYQPLVCIGGHMHENFGKCKIKKTVCINAGFGSYVNTWLELKGNKINTLEFYRGK